MLTWASEVLGWVTLGGFLAGEHHAFSQAMLCLALGRAWPMSTAQATFAVLLNQSLTRMRQDVEKK